MRPCIIFNIMHWSHHVHDLSIVNLYFHISVELNSVSIGRKGDVRWQHAWRIMTRTESHRAEVTKPEVLVCLGTMVYRLQAGLGQYNRNTANFLDPDKITLHAHTHTHRWCAKVRWLECICVLFDFPVACIQVYFVSWSCKTVLTLPARGLDVYF